MSQSELSAANEDFVAIQLSEGRYANRDELLDSAVDLLRSRWELRQIVSEGCSDLLEGRTTTYDESTLRDRFDRLKEQMQARLS